MRTLKLAVLALVLFAAPAFAASVAVTSVGQSWDLYFNGTADVGGVPTVLPGVSAHVDFSVTGLYYDSSINRTILTMDVVIANTTDPSIWQSAAVSGIGFNTDPNVTRVGSGSSGDFGFIALNKSLPTQSGFLVEVCVSGFRSSCNSLTSNATGIGQVGHATVQLAFLGQVNGPITFDNFGIRYNDVLSSLYKVSNDAALGVPVTPPIPEPASAALFGLGAAAVAGALRIRKR